MATRSVDIQQVAARKMLAQLIKHQKSDCVGLLIGHRNDKTVVVTDAVPLFHDHIFTGMLEVAMEMVDTCYNFQETDAIVGVYDAPVRARSQKETALTAVASQIAEKIKETKNTVAAIAVSASVLDNDEEVNDDAKVSEVPENESGELVLDAFAVGGFGAAMKKLEMTMESEV